ncbi:GAP family protein [Mycolicibacterium fortuitum]
MWGPLLLLALLFTVNPVRLGIILLVLSRPRPMQNLLVYWIGILVVGLAYLLIPLVLLHSTPTSVCSDEKFRAADGEPHCPDHGDHHRRAPASDSHRAGYSFVRPGAEGWY